MTRWSEGKKESVKLCAPAVKIGGDPVGNIVPSYIVPVGTVPQSYVLEKMGKNQKKGKGAKGQRTASHARTVAPELLRVARDHGAVLEGPRLSCYADRVRDVSKKGD